MEVFVANNVENLINILELVPKDVHFLFSGDEAGELGAHSFWLANCSDTFKAQFFGVLKQTEITVEDFSRESFKLFLDILYVQKLDWPSINLSSFSDLFRLADKYLVVGLETFLWTKLVGRLRKESGLDTLLEMIHQRTDRGTLAWKISEDLLKKQAWPGPELVTFEQWRSEVGVGFNNGDVIEPLVMRILDAFQQTLDAVMKKMGDVKDVKDEAEKLIETLNEHNAALTQILIESPLPAVPPILQELMCNVCNIGFASNMILEIHSAGGKHIRRALALGPGGDA